MEEWNKRTLKHIDYEEDKVKQWHENEANASMHSGVFNYNVCVLCRKTAIIHVRCSL